MKRMLLTVFLAAFLLIVSAGIAGANWWVELEYIDGGGGGGTDFEIVYHEDANDPDTWSTCNMYWLTPENPGPADVSVTDTAAGSFAGWMVMAIGDDGAAGCMINKMTFMATNPVDGDLICSINFTTPGSLDWDSDNPSFVCNINGANYSGPQMMEDGRLVPGPVPCLACTPFDPWATTYDATEVGTVTAGLNGSAGFGGEEPPFEETCCGYINDSETVWFEYGTASDTSDPYSYTYSTTHTVTYTQGSFSEDIDQLSSNTTYYYRAVVSGIYGNEKSFTTLGGTTESLHVSGTGSYNFGGQVNATIDVTSLTTPGTITIIVHPNEFHPAASGDSVKRWFEITSTAVGTFDLTLRYEEGELGSEDEGVLKLWRYTAGGWDSNGPWGVVDTVNNEVTATGITEFSDWVIADEGGPQPPVPEIITIVLMTLGLLSLVGFIYLRYRKNLVPA